VIIAVTADIRADSHKAHAINTFKTAGGFERLGHEVVVLCRPPAAGHARDAGARLGERRLAWRLCPLEGPEPGEYHAGWSRRFAAWAVDEALALRAHAVYARHFDAAIAVARSGVPAALETHAPIGSDHPALEPALRSTRDAAHPLHAVITISPALRAHYVERGADAARVHVVPDGVDLDLFAPPASLPPCPFERGGARMHAVYAGSMTADKGVRTLALAAADLTADGVMIHALGPMSPDLARAIEEVPPALRHALRLEPPVPHVAVAPFLWHADALIIPNGARCASALWTSPVKLSEYLAAGPPIVASDIPALRDLVDERVVRWFAPDDPADLARALRSALAESAQERSTRSAAARTLSREFGYPRRAARILGAIGLAGTCSATPIGTSRTTRSSSTRTPPSPHHAST
jgi:glycosyltransferase involved in cell wall biosynthesis